MARSDEFKFAEIMIDRLLLESFSSDKSAYYSSQSEKDSLASLDKYRKKLKWHINHSLSTRQKQVISYYLSGKKEREIASVLGITQQVVNIYKHRAIKKLRQLIS